MYIVLSDLQDKQRETLSTHMTIEKVKYTDITLEKITALYHKIYIESKTSPNDPTIRSGDSSRQRTFYVDDYGTWDDGTSGTYYGWWAVEEESGIEGFLDENNDVF